MSKKTRQFGEVFPGVEIYPIALAQFSINAGGTQNQSPILPNGNTAVVGDWVTWGYAGLAGITGVSITTTVASTGQLGISIFNTTGSTIVIPAGVWTFLIHQLTVS